MNLVDEHLQLLGHRARDLVTGFEGVVESIAFDLYGCVQACVRAPHSKDKPSESPWAAWYDVKRLKVLSKVRVMEVPSAESIKKGHEMGGCDKPSRG